VARRLTREGKYRTWSAVWRTGAPDHLVEFVELLARHPLPLGVNARERRRIVAATGEAPGVIRGAARGGSRIGSSALALTPRGPIF
jgi:hypothetical protein